MIKFILFLFINYFQIPSVLDINVIYCFYFFKYDCKWVCWYLWFYPVMVFMTIKLLLLAFFSTTGINYSTSVKVQKQIYDWYFSYGERDMLHFSNIFYYPFKSISDFFRITGFEEQITCSERLLLYISSFFIITVLSLLWVKFLFISMLIEVVIYEIIFFKNISLFTKSFVLLSFILLIIICLSLAISIPLVILLISSFPFYVFYMYSVNYGDKYIPLYFSVLNGRDYCIVTTPQFRIYNNIPLLPVLYNKS